MPRTLALIALRSALLAGATTAMAAKPCDELKSEIAAKLDAKAVKSYTLDVVATDQVGDQKVVGSCEAGSKKVVYKRG
jgi:hypothetical protein